MTEGAWVMLGTVGRWEYWAGPSGDVFRRKVSDWNTTGPDGAPTGARWESTRAHYDRWVAPQVQS